jgi:hypothetical protein
MKFIIKVFSILIPVLALNCNVLADGPFEEIMKKGFKGSKTEPALLKKVLGGSATKAEKAKLKEYISKLASLKPEKGTTESWKGKTTALIKAMEKDDLKALKEATNCKACHKAHK